MINLQKIISQVKKKRDDIKDHYKDSKLEQLLPFYLGEIFEKYFRLEVTGLENIPTQGSAIISPNHSGFSGFDALILSHQIFKNIRRVPRVLTHRFWFLSKITSIPLNKFGFIEAKTDEGLEILNKKKLLMIFPEGELGNFKPSIKKYHLQEFKRGFVRLALQTQSPIIPTLVIGAEETHFNLAQLKLNKYIPGLVIPIPLNIIPLPAKWKIVFLPPIYLPYSADAANDSELVHEICGDLREKMQRHLSKLVSDRKTTYF